MKKTHDLKKFHQSINDAYYDIELKQQFPHDFYSALLDGENELYQKSVTEIKKFHENWIKTIESYFASIYKIANNPKSGLRYDQEVTAIEKAKRVNSDSVRHLSANTHLIKEIRNHNVIPKGILVTNAEIEYAIYENRFIKTLVDRLFDFVNRRYRLVKNNIESYDKKHFNMKSHYQIQDSKVDFELNINITEDVEDESINKKNKDMLKKIEYLLKQINNLYKTEFMQLLKNAKPVKTPIMQTSILLKNVDYKNCYTLWLYLDRYNTLDFDTEITEKNLTFDKMYMKNIYQLALQSFTTIYANQKDLEHHYQYLDERTYHKRAPKVVKKHLESLVTSGTNVEMEDIKINQYFLEQSKKVFDQSIEKYKEESSTYEVALKKALRDTIKVSNALYQSYFDLGIDEDEDSFMFRSLQQTSTEDEIVQTKNKIKVAKLIRETKEVDYNDSIRLEKRLMKDLDQLNKQLIKENKKRIQDEAKRAKLEEKAKLERVNAQKFDKSLNKHLEYVSKKKTLMQEEHKKVNEKIIDVRRKIKEEEEKVIAREKAKAKLLYEKQVERIKAKQARERLRLEKQMAKKLELEKERLKKQEAKIKAQSKLRIEKQKQKIKDSQQKKLEKLK